jgi:hypothetical protein
VLGGRVLQQAVDDAGLVEPGRDRAAALYPDSRPVLG